jgi:hypothetical protein
VFNRIIGIFTRKKEKGKETVRPEIVKDKTETTKYLDPECNLYRYSKFDFYSDKSDVLYEFIEGFHTIPVQEEVTFEEAISKSIAFKENCKDFEKKLLLHQSLMNSEKGTRGSTYKYIFEDGSLLTTLLWYRDKQR